MKKLLLLVPLFFTLGACKPVEDPLPEPTVSTNTEATTGETPQIRRVKITKANCGLTNDDSTEAFTTSLDIEGLTDKYRFEVGPNCYNHAEYEEFLIKKDGYFKSVSTYHVDRLIIDYMSKKGVNFKVLNATNEEVASHASTVQTEYPGESDYGAVLEYPINGTAWKITNDTDYKAAFYSVTVVFTA